MSRSRVGALAVALCSCALCGALAPVAAVGADSVYWDNPVASRIAFAPLDGSVPEGIEFLPSGAGITSAEGIAIDPAAGRIYWANTGVSNISFANLDGSGGGELQTGMATVAGPTGIAIDPAAGRAYWANNGGPISFANLDGSGGSDLPTSSATTEDVRGVAIDPAAGRIYWVNASANKISSANLDGRGGRTVLGMAGEHPKFPVLLLAPRPVGAPAIAGRGALGATLSCTKGAWAPDGISSFLYLAPQSFSHQWSRNGSDLPGATQSTLTARAAGDYRCRVTARNFAGPSAQTSSPFHVQPEKFGRRTLVSLRLLGGVSPGGTFKVQVVNANAFVVTGSLSVAKEKSRSAARRRLLGHGAKRFSAAAHGKRTVKLLLPGSLRRQLSSRGRISLSLKASVFDPAGDRRIVKKKVALRSRAGRSG